MSLYYQDEACRCGCGAGVSKGRMFLPGHNGRGRPKTAEHRAAISAAQRVAWATKRDRHPLGSKNHDSHGYVRLKVRHGGRWAKEHVSVVEQAVGRPIRNGEVVHHINAVRDDNRVENLHLFESMSAHNKAHASFERLLAGLLSDGIVSFNAATGEYDRC